MEKVSIKQRVMAHQEYGVKLSSQTTERQAARILNRNTTFKGKVVWSNKLR